MWNKRAEHFAEWISQEELNTLLAALQVAEQRRRRSEAPTVALYDFRYASKLSPDHMRVLQRQMLSLAAVLTRTLSLYLNNTAHIQVHSLDVSRTEQYIRNLEANPILGVVRFGHGLPPVLWDMSTPLAFAALDCMLGGTGLMEGEVRREATNLERAVLRRLFTEILSAWTELWERLRALRPQVEAVVTSVSTVDLRAGDERLFCAALDATIGRTRGLIRLCLPLNVVRRLLREEHKFAAPADLASAAQQMPLAQALSTAPVPITVTLQSSPLVLHNLLTLKPGEVIDLRVPVTEPFVLCVNGQPKFRVQPGTQNGRLAVEVLSAA